MRFVQFWIFLYFMIYSMEGHNGTLSTQLLLTTSTPSYKQQTHIGYGMEQEMTPKDLAKYGGSNPSQVTPYFESVTVSTQEPLLPRTNSTPTDLVEQGQQPNFANKMGKQMPPEIGPIYLENIAQSGAKITGIPKNGSSVTILSIKLNDPPVIKVKYKCGCIHELTILEVYQNGGIFARTHKGKELHGQITAVREVGDNSNPSTANMSFNGAAGVIGRTSSFVSKLVYGKQKNQQNDGVLPQFRRT